MRTQRPRSATGSTSRLEERASAASSTRAVRPDRVRPPSSELSSSQSRSQRASAGGIFVGLHEIAERNRESDVVGCGERIDAERILEPDDQNGKAQRIEPGIEQNEVIRQRRKLCILLGRDARDLGGYR